MGPNTHTIKLKGGKESLLMHGVVVNTCKFVLAANHIINSITYVDHKMDMQGAGLCC